MARITLNEFAKRPTRIGVGFIFDDYYHLQKSGEVKGKIRLKTGGELPTPNEVLRKLAAKVKGDYHLKSDGAKQTLMLTDMADAKPFVTNTTPLREGDGKPLNAFVAIHIPMEKHVQLATELGLM
jgi:hypothetical protein